MKTNKKTLRNVTALVLCAGAAVVPFLFLGLRLNLTPSHVPAGFWRARPAASAGPVRVGDVITYDVREFYAAEPRIAEERMTFAAPRVIKRVAALPGALIDLSGDTFVVDGKAYPRARRAGNTWSKVDYPLVVPEGTVWLMDDVLAAYDSRYHGPLPMRLIKEKNEPLWVWE
ncbi:MAG: S26 family signal peptidase [Synergistaceae bacterium]|nr:S26 family signal peptidase [Synergistaceae bacterium]